MAEKTPENPRGAGRKLKDPMLKTAPISIRLPIWIIEKLRFTPETQSKLIEKALIGFYQWQQPENKKDHDKN